MGGNWVSEMAKCGMLPCSKSVCCAFRTGGQLCLGRVQMGFPSTSVAFDSPLRLARWRREVSLKEVRLDTSSPFRRRVMTSQLRDYEGIGVSQGDHTCRFPRDCTSTSTNTSTPHGVFESWLEKAVFDIVRHLQDAPFLHLVYGAGESTRHKVSREVLDNPEQWTCVKKSVSELCPDGIIMVHRLDPSSLGSSCIAGLPGDACSAVTVEELEEGSELWGLLVQAKSLGRSACYVLQTTRVASTCGACTRFSITRAKCFGPSLATQIQNAWLV